MSSVIQNRNLNAATRSDSEYFSDAPPARKTKKSLECLEEGDISLSAKKPKPAPKKKTTKAVASPCSTANKKSAIEKILGIDSDEESTTKKKPGVIKSSLTRRVADGVVRRSEELSGDLFVEQCPLTRDGALNVHLIPHSHMDAGWVKTFEQYYFGAKSKLSAANVQLIYHSVLTELLHDKRRKFTFAETAFFWRWWKEQRQQTRATFRSLVAEGRIEFAGGAWVQNDEATPDYLHIIDQYTWGLRKINDTLGPCGKPKAAWQIDSYGHTREQVALLAQMGYDGLFIGRVDSKSRQSMMDDYRMEFMWRGSDVLGKMSDIMVHTLYNLYNAPDGFCFDFLCSDEPIIDDPDDRVYNAEKRVNDFIAHIEKQAKYYDHDNILVTMGGDFTYQSAANWFINMDKLINHVNSHPANLSDINIFYSTPSCYLKAIYLYGRRDKAIYTEKGDYIPYGSDVNTYWTGYYSSRPSIKYLARRAHVYLQILKQLTVLARSGDSYELHLLRHAVALVLHHDAITGTSQQHVTNDYVRLLSEAIDVSTKKISHLLSTLTPTWGGTRRSKNNQMFTACHQLNMTQCRFMESQDSMIVLIYNLLSVKTYHYVRLPAVALHYSIRDANDEEVEYQLVPLPAAVKNLPGRTSPTVQELVFEAENIPALGFSAYYIATVRDQLEENAYVKKSHGRPEESELLPFISNEYLRIQVNKQTGLLESIQHVDGIKLAMSQNFYFYSQREKRPQAGAYTFRPENNRPTPITERATYQNVKGSLVKEIRQRFTDWITQVIRLYRGEDFVEFEWIIGPVPVGSDLGKDVVTVYSTNITNEAYFFTDSNSKQMIKRTCLNETSSRKKKLVPACYYPVSSRICIHADNRSVEMCVLTERTQGGTSYNDGEIELMLHRRLRTDDEFGLEEHLNEEAYGTGLVVRGRHRVVFGNFKIETEGLTFSERVSHTARRFNYEPHLFFTTGERINRRKWQSVRSKRFSGLRAHGLPRHVRALTLEPWKSGSVLLRLENTLESSIRSRVPVKQESPEDGARGPVIAVDLRKIFVFSQMKAARETTLAANQWLSDARQMDWGTRYVYAGGDDGILPEDNMDYKEEKTVENKESVPYSDEETDSKQRRTTTTKWRKTKTTSRKRSGNSVNEYERKKRSVNSTENFVDSKYNKKDLIIIKENIETKLIAGRKHIDSNGYQNVTETDKNEENTKNKLNNSNRKAMRFSINSKRKPVGVVDDVSKNSEEDDSEEDFAYMSRRRAKLRNRRKNTKVVGRVTDEIHPEETDDGVTKSIYEMYYKRMSFDPSIFVDYETDEPKIRRKHKKRNKSKLYTDSQEDLSRSIEITTRKNKSRIERKNRKREKEISEEYERGLRKRGNKKLRASESVDSHKKVVVDESSAVKTELSKLRAKKRKFPHADDDYDQSDLYDYEMEERDRERTYGGRKKRMAKSEDNPETGDTVEQPEQYVVMLRPTQIRTFVVWFEDKKTY